VWPRPGVVHSMRSGKEGHERISLLASLRFKVASQIYQRQRLDQQTLSFVATARTEAHDNNACRAFRRHPPRQRRVARRQEVGFIETNAAQKCRTGIFHHQQITAAAAPVALPFAVQRPDHHQIRGSARFLCQTFAFLLGKRLRNPVSPVRRLDRRVPASADGVRFRSTHPVPFWALGADSNSGGCRSANQYTSLIFATN
jgi:hypothetical protein